MPRDADAQGHLSSGRMCLPGKCHGCHALPELYLPFPARGTAEGIPPHARITWRVASEESPSRPNPCSPSHQGPKPGLRSLRLAATAADDVARPKEDPSHG